MSTLFSVGVLALGIAVATLLAGVGWARKREARTAAALEAAQAVEPHKQPMRYLLFLLHLHPPHRSEKSPSWRRHSWPQRASCGCIRRL